MKKLLKLITGELLHLANREFRTGSFYSLKDRILASHGTPAGYNAQHIVKKCYKCENGKISTVVMLYGEPWRTKKETCYHCGGTGIYDEFWVILEIYKVGLREFHKPIKRIHDQNLFEVTLKEQGIIPRIHFEGLIRHEPPHFRLGYEAGWWLVLMFAREEMKSYWFGMTWITGAYLPLLLINNLIYFWTRSILPRLRSARRRFCWHEFETDAWALTQYDSCKKCGIERWQADGDENPIPF